MTEPERVGGGLIAGIRKKMVARGRMVDVQGTDEDIAGRQSLGTTICRECGDSGFVRRDVDVGHPDFGRAIRCKACLDQSVAQRLSTLPTAFRDWSMDSFKALIVSRGFPEQELQKYRNVLIDCMKWLRLEDDGENNWLYLFSTASGRGKTGLAIALYRALLESGASGMFRIFGDVLDDVRDSFGVPGAERIRGESLIHRMKTAEVLVLDDLGAHRFTPWVTEDVIWPILAHRHSENLRTIFTSNLDLDELSRQLQHPRVASRIRERAGQGSWVISLDGFPNLREPN